MKQQVGRVRDTGIHTKLIDNRTGSAATDKVLCDNDEIQSVEIFCASFSIDSTVALSAWPILNHQTQSQVCRKLKLKAEC